MTLLYYIWDGDWWVYGLLFFVPDLSFAAYLSGAAFRRPDLQRSPQLSRADGDDDDRLWHRLAAHLSIAMIWLAHIGFDRALGYGPEIRERIRLHPYGADREASELTAD
jgi:hypothetical protein